MSAQHGRSAAIRLAAGGMLGVGVLAGAAWLILDEPGQRMFTAASAGDLLEAYCVDCHNDTDFTANLSLEDASLETAGHEAVRWEPVVRKLRAGMMPPPGLPRPDRSEYALLTNWLEQTIDAAAAEAPGTKLLHRLNRTEYANAVRDLLDIEIDPARFLPADDSSRGFDNIAGSLTISPTLLEAYDGAAAKIARMAVGFWSAPTEALYIARTDSSQVYRLEGQAFGTRGGMSIDHVFPADGDYRFTVRNLGVGTYIPDEVLELDIDGERVHSWVYTGMGTSGGMTSDGDGELTVTVPVRAGSRRVSATFIATNYRPSLDVAQHFERKSLENGTVRELSNYPVIGALRVEGPFNATRPEDSASIRKVFVCRPESPADEPACATEIIATLARRAFRRPVASGDLEQLLGFYEDGRAGGSFEDGIELALRRLLASPQFLVRVEREPEDLAPGEIYRISDLELASRLSFFLWSSLPDDELIGLAASNALGRPDVLEAQVRRMLADPRSASLVTNFAQQWLYLRNLGTTAPAQTEFPDWDDELREAFARETELLFEHIVREDRSILEMLDADYTFVNERLARHYGIPNIYGSHYRRIPLGPERAARRGILGHGSFLSMTWVQNNRTSPVKRGVWVLENILGTPPPEPPPDVPGLEETPASGADGALSLREQMTLHRTNEPCAGCHQIMDPIGFALENYSADGQWREMDGGPGGTPIDATAELWDGTRVDGPIGLRQALLRYSPQFTRMLTEKLMTYALGRGVEYFDMPTVRSIATSAEENGHRFSSLVLGIVSSTPFQMRTKSDDGPGERVADLSGD